MPSVPVIAVEGKAGNGQRLALLAGFLDPVVAAAGNVAAVADLGDDALEADLAGMRIHLAAVDLKAFAELDIGVFDYPFELRLALDEWQLPKIVAVEVERRRPARSWSTCPSARFAGPKNLCRRRRPAPPPPVDDGGSGGDMPGVVGDLAKALGPVVAAPREYLDRLVGEMDLDAVAVELDLVKPAPAVVRPRGIRANAGAPS
jgi:hypothetical protein